jgi:hypothetical protein
LTARRGCAGLLVPHDRAGHRVERVNLVLHRRRDDEVLPAGRAFEIEGLRERRALDHGVEVGVLVDRGGPRLGERRVDVEAVAREVLVVLEHVRSDVDRSAAGPARTCAGVSCASRGSRAASSTRRSRGRSSSSRGARACSRGASGGASPRPAGARRGARTVQAGRGRTGSASASGPRRGRATAGRAGRSTRAGASRIRLGTRAPRRRDDGDDGRRTPRRYSALDLHWLAFR